MEGAAFSINTYQFDKVSIDLSNLNENEPVTIKFTTQGEFKKSDSSFKLTFNVKLTNNSSKDLPYVVVNCIGIFKFVNAITFNEIPDYFYKNSIAILFPYLRAYVSIVTTQANIPGIIIPTYNLSHLESELRVNSLENLN